MLNKDPLKEDFRSFLFIIWKHLRLPDPTPIQYDIAHWLQHGPRRQMTMAFRGVGKSWITSAFVLWKLYCDPQLKILVVSASKARADDFSTFTLRLIQEVPILRHLQPKDDQRQSKLGFDVGPAKADHSPSVKSAGITGQITGTRADLIVADDIEVANNSDTQLAREKLAEAVKEFDAILKPSGSVVYLGTPQNELSLYNQLPSRGYVIRVWPARIPKDTERYGTRLAPIITRLIERGALPGSPTDSARFGEEDLRERELSYGRSGFALQFQLDTSLSDAEKFPLKLSDLCVMSLHPEKAPVEIIWASSPELEWKDVPNVGLEGDRLYRPMYTSPEFADYTGSIMFVDPSGRGKDETGVAVVKARDAMLFVTYLAGFRGGYHEDNLRKIMLIAKDQKVNQILVEPNMGDGMFAQLLKGMASKIYKCAIDDAEWVRTQKEARIIDTLEPVMNAHRLVIDKKIMQYDYDSTLDYIPEEQNRYRFAYQLTRITRDRGSLVNDDRLDALAGAVKFWIDSMAKNREDIAREHRNEALKQELDRFMKHALGAPSKASGSAHFMKGLKAMKGKRNFG